MGICLKKFWLETARERTIGLWSRCQFLSANLGQSKCHVQPDKDFECEKNRGEISLHCTHQTRDGSTVATLDERESRGCSTEHLAKDKFCKNNHYI